MENPQLEKALNLQGKSRRGVIIGPDGREKRGMAQAMQELAEGYMNRTEIEESAGAEPVGHINDLVKIEEQARLEATIKIVERMNQEMSENESLRVFLMGLHNLSLRNGKPTPRKLLMQSGTPKKALNGLVKTGFIQEHYLRHNQKGVLYSCFSLPEGITFYGKQAVAVVREPDLNEGTAETLKDSLGGVDEVVSILDEPTSASPVHEIGD